jgi:hypothetical protein
LPNLHPCPTLCHPERSWARLCAQRSRRTCGCLLPFGGVRARLQSCRQCCIIDEGFSP